MSGHTKGPWRTHTHKRFIEVFWLETGKRIASVPLSQFTENSQNEANARLIAAGPDLLDALKGILTNHETIGIGASIFQCTNAEVKAARAAVAKATGAA